MIWLMKHPILLQSWFLRSRIVASLVVLLLCFAPHAVAATAAPNPVYDDALAANWENWSWGTTVNLAAAVPVQAGTRSIGAIFTDAWGGLYLHNSGVAIAGYTHLQFW